jgi:hypothetical protein
MNVMVCYWFLIIDIQNILLEDIVRSLDLLVYPCRSPSGCPKVAFPILTSGGLEELAMRTRSSVNPPAFTWKRI